MVFSEEQCLIRDSVRDFVQERVLPFAADWDRDNHFPQQHVEVESVISY